MKNTNQSASSDEAVLEAEKLEYNTVMSPLMDKYEGKWNGAMILPILAVGVSMLSTLLPTWIEKAKASRRGIQFTQTMPTNKTMLVVMPVIMGIFTSFYNSVFGLYIVVGALFGLITSPLMSVLTESLESKIASRQAQNVSTVSYSRKRPVDITNNQPKNNTKNTNKK